MTRQLLQSNGVSYYLWKRLWVTLSLTWWTSLVVVEMVKYLLAVKETRVQTLGWEGSLEKEMAIHSSILAWRIPRTEGPGDQRT